MVRNDVKYKVKVKLEELSPFEEPTSLLAVPNNNVKPIDSYIEDDLDAAFDKVLMNVPLYLVRETLVNATSSATLTVDSDKVGHITEPTNFLRLHSLLVTGWKRVVNVAIGTTTPKYILQRNPHTRGGNEKPVVAINEGDIELYTVKATSPTITKFKYIPKTQRKGAAGATAGATTFEDGLVDFLVLQCAIDVLEEFEQFDKVTTLSQELEKLILERTI